MRMRVSSEMSFGPITKAASRAALARAQAAISAIRNTASGVSIITQTLMAGSAPS